MSDFVTLSISSKNLDCSQVTEKLLKMKILSSVIKNESIVSKNNNFYKEFGCNVKFNKFNLKNLENLWYPLKKEFKLGCAHLDVKNTYSGCINKYFKNKQDLK